MWLPLPAVSRHGVCRAEEAPGGTVTCPCKWETPSGGEIHKDSSPTSSHGPSGHEQLLLAFPVAQLLPAHEVKLIPSNSLMNNFCSLCLLNQGPALSQRISVSRLWVSTSSSFPKVDVRSQFYN